MELETYLDALASGAPVPGGGSAATVVAACAAALVAMIARITQKNAAYVAVAPEAQRLVASADALRSELLAARLADEGAYGSVVAAQALPKSTAPERTERTAALQRALAAAAAAPLHVAALALRALELSSEAAALGNAHLASDVTCAAAFARAALVASAANVRINHAFLRDPQRVAEQEAILRELERKAMRPGSASGGSIPSA